MLALVIPAFVAISPLGPTTVRFLILAEVRTSSSLRVVVSATLRSLMLAAVNVPVAAEIVVGAGVAAASAAGTIDKAHRFVEKWATDAYK